MKAILIIGAGLLGRLLAVQLHAQGHHVSLIDQDHPEGTQSCGYAGAGMLTPFAELTEAEPLITRLGLQSLARWPALLSLLDEPVFFQQAGSLVISHPGDQPDFERFKQTLKRQLASGGWLQPDVCKQLDTTVLKTLEPGLQDRFTQALYLPDEGQLDNRQLMNSLARTIVNQKIAWHSGMRVQTLSGPVLRQLKASLGTDRVIDCRGLGAQPDWPGLRGVRGELIVVHAPEVNISRPVRLMHPRYPLYIVPRPDHRFIIGATSIESDDRQPMTLQSALELLSAAYTVHPGFAEAKILELVVNCRPALPNHLPAIHVYPIYPAGADAEQPALLRLNGLYRHGFLLAPVLTQAVCDMMTTGKLPDAPDLKSLCHVFGPVFDHAVDHNFSHPMPQQNLLENPPHDGLIDNNPPYQRQAVPVALI